MSKILSLLVVSVLALPMIACSSNGAPSDSEVKKKVLANYEARIPDKAVMDTLKVNFIECEASETEDVYFCLVSTSAQHQGELEKDTSSWKFTKANKEWFMKGPMPTSRAEAERAEAN